MCVALIGGIDRLERHYIHEAARFGIDLRVFSKPRANTALKIKNADALVIFTNKVSHRTRKEVIKVARAKDIPVFMYHSCGICTLRNCFNCMKNKTHREQQ